MGMRKKYTAAFKKEAVDRVLLDKLSVLKVGQELGIDKFFIRRWVLSCQKQGIVGLMPLLTIHNINNRKMACCLLTCKEWSDRKVLSVFICADL